MGDELAGRGRDPTLSNGLDRAAEPPLSGAAAERSEPRPHGSSADGLSSLNGFAQPFMAVDRATVRYRVSLALVMGLAGVSMVLNFRFGLLILAGPERWVFAIAVTLLDGLKTVLLNHVAAHLSDWRRPASILKGSLGLAIWAGAVAFSLSCAVGLYAMARDARASGIQSIQEQRQDLIGQRDRLIHRIDALDRTRPAEVVAGEIAARKHSAIWDRSKQCADATLEESRSFCADLAWLEAEFSGADAALALRERRAAAEADLRRVRAKLAEDERKRESNDGLAIVFGRIDAAAEAIATLIGWSVGEIRSRLAALIGLLVEGVAAAGLFVLSNDRPRSPPQERGRRHGDPAPKMAAGAGVEEWAAIALSRRRSSTAGATQMHRDYARWAAALGYEVATQTAFGARLSKLGFGSRGRNDAGVFYRGVAFTPRAPDAS